VIAGVLLVAATRSASAQTTFSKDVAPIVFEHCAPCHRAGEIGPFALTSYRDVRQRATQIVDVIRRRVMPPWKPRGDPALFVGARVLTEAQIDTIRDWVAQGALEGSSADLLVLPPPADGWQLGRPDVIVTMPQPYVLRAEGRDVFRTFVLPTPTTSARFVRAIEFRPGNARAVHHANIGVDRSRASRRLDALDVEPGYDGGMVPDASYPPGHMLGWTPGQRPRASPEGTAWRLEPESDIVVQLHLQPTGKPEPVQVSIGVYFTDQPPTRTPIGLRLGSQTIDIPPDVASYVVTDQFELPVDAEVLAIQPHAHNLGRTVQATATLPDGSMRALVDIADWDFRWQDVYRYARPIPLPRGTTINMRFDYDNSAANVRNPFRPPRRVVWGQNTFDEMGDLWVQLIARSESDAARLAAEVERKRRVEDLAGYTKVLELDRYNPLRHEQVAMIHLGLGRVDEAIKHLREALRLHEGSAPTHYNLGIALSLQRKFDGALAEFRRAIALDPGHAEAHNNAGAMLHVAGKLDDAAVHYRRALELRPDNLDARSNLGRILSAAGRDADAADEFRRVLAVRPDHVSALAGLGWVLATSANPAIRDPQAAVRAAQQASTLTSDADAAALDGLAAAYASAGDFTRAVSIAERALEAARRSGLPGLADQVSMRLALYKSGQPYRRYK
jgi:tetratricopeptide (TPR) repeat protein